MSKIELTDMNIELMRRFVNQKQNHEDLCAKLEWLAGGLTRVTTATAFQLAKGGRDVWGIDNDADYYIEVEVQDEHYPDKSKSYPEIETIFVVEGKL